MTIFMPLPRILHCFVQSSTKKGAAQLNRVIEKLLIASVLSFLFLSGAAVSSAAIVTEPGKASGGAGYDAVSSVQQTQGGGLVIAGYTRSSGTGSHDAGLIRIPSISPSLSAMDMEWNKTFGGAEWDVASSVQQTKDSGYIIAGYTYSYGAGEYDVWLIKTDTQGTELWSTTFGGAKDDAAYSVQQTQDGGYIIAGYTESYGAGGYDVWLIKTDTQGTELWSRTFGGARDDAAYSVRQTQDGGFIIAGYTESYGAGYYSSDVWLIKTDTQGTELWKKAFGGVSSDKAFSVRQTQEGGYIIAGYTESYGAGRDDAWLVKTDTQGTELWKKTFGGVYSDIATAVRQTQEGGFIIAGYTESYNAGDYNAWIIKTDSQGAKLWEKTFGGADDDGATSIQQTQDGGYIIAGYTWSYGTGYSDVWLIKTDPQGAKLWEKTFGGAFWDKATAVQQTQEGGFIIAGYTISNVTGKQDAWLIKISPKNIPPAASFFFTPGSPIVNEAITFDASASTDPDGQILLYEWDFGDGNRVTRTNAITTYTYSQDGPYTVILTVTDNRGARNQSDTQMSLITRKILNLAPGYNALSLPLTLTEGLTAYELLADIPYCGMILTRENNQWQSVVKVNGQIVTGRDFPLELERGYLILCREQSSYTFQGHTIKVAIYPELEYGFNLSRIYDPQKTYTSHQSLREFQSAGSLLSYNTQTGEWAYTAKGFSGTITGPDFTLDPNKAYLIYSDQVYTK